MIRDTDRITIRSCHGSGKSFVSARAIVWFLRCHPNSLVITTAPVWNQVKDILWREITNAVINSRVPLGGRMTQTSWELGPKWYALGRSTDQPERFQGYHAAVQRDQTSELTDEEFWAATAEEIGGASGHIMLVVDEASGVDERIYEAARGFLTTKGAKMLLIGNPTRGDGTFFNTHKEDSSWMKMKISAFEVPERLLSREWIEEQRKDYGEESPFWDVRVMGDFPREGSNTLFPLYLVEGAVDRKVDKFGNPLNEEGSVEFGVDVAAQGDNRTAVAIRRGMKLLHLEAWSEFDTLKTCERIRRLAEEYDPKVIKIDVGAMGKGVIDVLKRVGLPIQAVHFGQQPRDTARFGIARDEMYWGLSQRFRDYQITGVKNKKLQAELTPITFEIDAREKVKVEPKDEMKRRGLPSPDNADALCLAFYSPQPVSRLSGLGDMSLIYPVSQQNPEMAEKERAYLRLEGERIAQEQAVWSDLTKRSPEMRDHLEKVLGIRNPVDFLLDPTIR